MLETWNVVRKYTHICSFRKHTFQYQGFPNFADVSIFLRKIILGENSPSFQTNHMEAVLDFLVLFSVFVW